MGTDSSFGVDARHEDGRLVVVPRGELDIATIEPVRKCLVERGDGEGVELDLRGVRFLDTSGLQLIVEEHRRARRDGYDLSIRRGPAAVQRVFEIAGLEGVLPFAD